VLKVFLTLGAIQVGVMAVQLIKTKALALLLGPESLGVMAVVDKLVAVATQTSSLSLPFAASVYLPALWLRDRAGFLSLLSRMRNVLWVMSATAGVGGAILTLVQPRIWGEELEPHRIVVALAFLGIPALAFSPFVQSVLAGRLQERGALGFTFANACVVTTVALIGVLGWGLAGYYGLFAVIGSGFVAFAMSGARRSSERAPQAGSADGERAASERELSGGTWLPKIVWRFALMLLALTFLMPFAALFLHYAILVGLSAAAAGWMAAAIGISLAVKGVLGAANAVFLTPNVNRGGEPALALGWANGYARTLILLAGFLVPPLLLWPHLFVRILYSSEFLPGADYVWIFVLAEIVGLVVAVYTALPIAFDRVGFHVVYSGVGQVLMVLSATWLIPAYGILGAGLSMLVPHALATVCVGAFLVRGYGLPVPRGTIWLSSIVFAGLTLAGNLGVRLPELSLTGAGIKISAYGAIVAVLLTRVTVEERARAWALLSRRPRKATQES
jgi:antigen flippase